MSTQLATGLITYIRSRWLSKPQTERKIRCGHAEANSESKRRCFIEVYLFFPHTAVTRKIKLKNFFKAKLTNIDQMVSGQPIFLDQNHAQQYSRFMGDNHVILKAYVCEHAIEALTLRHETSSQGHLTIRSGFLAKELIHGCYPSFGKGFSYIQNPCFDAAIGID